uniref:GATA-type domain-containing protein n=1 Tax=Sphaeramia orbicularis TaxID=375764 RepID=A0A673CZY4_9TELE
MDTNSPSPWQNPFTVEREEDYSHVFHPVNGCNQSLNEPAKNVQEESRANNIIAVNEPLPECNSPLKVLTLINLQCERLLQPRDAAESRRSSLLSVPESGHSRNSSSSTAAFVSGQEADGDSLSFKVTLGHLINERQEITTSIGHVKDVKEVCGQGACGYKPQCSGTDCKKVCNGKPQTAENTGTVRPEQLEENTEASSHPPEVMFSGSNGLEWDNEQRTDCISTEENTWNSPFPEDSLSETHFSNASCNNHQLTFNVNEDASLAKPTLIFDHNANLYLSTDPTCNTLLPQTVLLQVSSSERCCLIDESTASTPECKQSSQLKSMGFCVETTPTPSVTLKSKPRSVQEEDGVPGTQQCPSWRAKTPRKQPHPSRSADIQDPDFQGVTFRMDTEVDDSSEQCQGKACASCCTQKTPMWRDAEDGTPLCNACGIRYKKYRVRCVNCWHIPRKEGNSNSCCLKCGNFVSLPSGWPHTD